MKITSVTVKTFLFVFLSSVSLFLSAAPQEFDPIVIDNETGHDLTVYESAPSSCIYQGPKPIHSGLYPVLLASGDCFYTFVAQNQSGCSFVLDSTGSLHLNQLGCFGGNVGVDISSDGKAAKLFAITTSKPDSR